MKEEGKKQQQQHKKRNDKLNLNVKKMNRLQSDRNRYSIAWHENDISQKQKIYNIIWNAVYTCQQICDNSRYNVAFNAYRWFAEAITKKSNYIAWNLTLFRQYDEQMQKRDKRKFYLHKMKRKSNSEFIWCISTRVQQKEACVCEREREIAIECGLAVSTPIYCVNKQQVVNNAHTAQSLDPCCRRIFVP